MADIRNLLNQIAAQESQLVDTQFLAPCVPGGLVRTAVANIVYTFTPQPPDFEGWGIFQPIDGKTAQVVDEAGLPQLAEYLKLLKPWRLRLAYLWQGQTWLAYPVNESDMQQRLGVAKPVLLHLVTQATAFEAIIARFDGAAWWFDEIDRRAQAQTAEQLKEFLRQGALPEAVRFAGMTPEMLTVYDLAWQQLEANQAQQAVGQRAAQRQRRRLAREERRQRKGQYLTSRQRTDEGRLREALRMGGGDLQEFRDQGEFWQVEWMTRNGERHTSAISKGDLTVISSGICLSGGDRNFDLQSLVGVIEARDQWDF